MCFAQSEESFSSLFGSSCLGCETRHVLDVNRVGGRASEIGEEKVSLTRGHFVSGVGR